MTQPIPNRCPSHNDPNKWIDQKPVNGQIKTTCKICGYLIGYRPAGTETTR